MKLASPFDSQTAHQAVHSFCTILSSEGNYRVMTCVRTLRFKSYCFLGATPFKNIDYVCLAFI